MRTELRPTLVMLALLTLLTGVLYPLAVTALARFAFPRQAAGSLIARGGELVGSRLIGQAFDEPKYFWGRLSATTPAPYDASASTGSNLGPLNGALIEAARARIAVLRAAESGAKGPVPVDLVTASGSGLDPEISPAAAEFQVARVARARGLSTSRVRDLVHSHTAPRAFGVFGEPRVNVLELNLALDAAMRAAPSSPATTNRPGPGP